MQREQKAAAVAEIGAELERSSAVFAVDYRGISVPQAAELRSRLGAADASFSVVKNRLAKRATEGAGVAELDQHLAGPTALTYVRGDAVVAAKTISDFVREHGVPTYKGGLMDGAVLSAEQFAAIARLPGLDQLRGQLVGLTASPLTGLARTLNQLVQGLAAQLGQVAEQGLIGGAAAEPEAGAAEPEAGGTEGAAEAEPEAGAEAATPEGDEPEAGEAATAAEPEPAEPEADGGEAPPPKADETPADGDEAGADDKED